MIIYDENFVYELTYKRRQCFLKIIGLRTKDLTTSIAKNNYINDKCDPWQLLDKTWRGDSACFDNGHLKILKNAKEVFETTLLLSPF